MSSLSCLNCAAAGPVLAPVGVAAPVLSRPSDQEFDELVRRLRPNEMEVLQANMASTTELGVDAVAAILNDSAAFINPDQRARIFSDAMAPYHALRAYKEGRISVDQFSTFQIHYHMTQHKKDELKVASLFLPDGSRNPEAEALFRAPDGFVRKVPGGNVAARAPYIQLRLNPTEEQVNEIFEKARLLPPSEQVVLSFPDTQPFKRSLGSDNDCPATITQAIAKAGLLHMNRAIIGETVVRVTASMGLMRLSADVVRAEGASMQMRPVLGLSTRRDILNGQEANFRDMVIPFPGVELPKTADGFEAPEGDGDFTVHDFYHGMVLAHVPDSYVRISLEIYKKLPGFDGQGSRYAQILADKFLDLEMLGDRFKELPRDHDKFWMEIVYFVMSAYMNFPSKESYRSPSEDGSPRTFLLKNLPGDVRASLEIIGRTVREVGGRSVPLASLIEEGIENLEERFRDPYVRRRYSERVLDSSSFQLEAMKAILKGWQSGASP